MRRLALVGATQGASVVETTRHGPDENSRATLWKSQRNLVMEGSAGIALISDVARDVLSEVAPREVPIFAAVSRAYFADPASALRQSRAKDDVLGFGMETAAALFTPAVLFVLSEPFEYLTRIAAKATADGLAKEIPELVKSMFRKLQSSQPAAPSLLTREDLAMIHRNILASAKKLHLPAEKAHSLANAVTAQLVLPKD